MEQISLLEQIDDNTTKNYLCIVKDDKIVDMTFKEIFDANAFDEFYAVTYVSSPAFFSKVVKDFKKVKFIIGIDDSEYLSSFTSGIEKFVDIKGRIGFWNDLQKEVKEKICDESISIRFTLDAPIHSKIYLLNNSETGFKRVVIGSANLTEKAFINKKQYEDIIIFDNDVEKYDLYYNQRFKPLFEAGVNYIPDIIRKKYLKNPSVILFSKEVASEILNNDLEINRNKFCVLTDEQMAELKSRSQQLEEQYEVKKEEIQRSTNIINHITKKKGNNYILKPPDELKKQTLRIETIITKASKSITDDVRQLYRFMDKTNTLSVVDKNNHEFYKPFSEKIDIENIRKNLELINRFVNAYELFTFKTNKTYQSKIMEIILFSFMSPYIWKLREEIVLKTSSESNRSTFPVFLVIAGRAASGKTTALEFIGLLLGNNSPYYIPYSLIQSGRTVDKNKLESYFDSEYLAPILVDEIPSSFFTGKTGENIIKEISNNTTGKHPVMIGTTNVREFNTTSQVLRRIYYIQVDSEFNTKEFNAESKKYLNEIESEIDNSLFKDFSYRIAEKIKNEEILYKENDCLFLAREIFKEYYKECGMNVPEWFPHQPFYDYEERGKEIWKNIYENNRDAFIEKDDGTIYVNTSIIFNNPRERENIVNYLGIGCVKEDSQILLLNGDIFYNYIGVKPRNSFISTIKKYIKR